MTGLDNVTHQPILDMTALDNRPDDDAERSGSSGRLRRL